jgi:hypothetical protein
MTPPNLPAPPRSHRNARPSAASRWKLAEPVRLYLWPVVLVLLVGAAGAGLVTQQWVDWSLPLLGLAASLVGAGEAARASVYSTRGHIESLHAASTRWAAAIRSGVIDQ